MRVYVHPCGCNRKNRDSGDEVCFQTAASSWLIPVILPPAQQMLARISWLHLLQWKYCKAHILIWLTLDWHSPVQVCSSTYTSSIQSLVLHRNNNVPTQTMCSCSSMCFQSVFLDSKHFDGTDYTLEDDCSQSPSAAGPHKQRLHAGGWDGNQVLKEWMLPFLNTSIGRRDEQLYV